ncbi:MAG TPA: hypothetical protein VLL54_11090 [Pyrinomonadaceae bacterium]|nr:hypothetical protein [Pyrinomonadaceae bacterium]
MNKIKTVNLLTLVVLLMGAFSVASAQQRMSAPELKSRQPLPSVVVLSGAYNMSVDAQQVSAGEVDVTSGYTVGWTWSGQTSGDLSGFMFLSVNYAAAEVIEAGDRKPNARKVIGGSWSKLIFIDDAYVGTISGQIVAGDVVWDSKAQQSVMNLELVADAGTDLFLGTSGTGTFSGMIDVSNEVPFMSGTLNLNY